MLRLVRYEQNVEPGNKLIVCSAQSYTLGGPRNKKKFRKDVPTEVTPAQFEYLMAQNATLGRAIFQEFLPKNQNIAPQGATDAVEELFAELPGEEKKGTEANPLINDPGVLDAFGEEVEGNPPKDGLRMKIETPLEEEENPPPVPAAQESDVDPYTTPRKRSSRAEKGDPKAEAARSSRKKIPLKKEK